MTPKKKKSLNKKLKAKVSKYESELDEYLGALDDAKRCKYDEVSLISDFYHITVLIQLKMEKTGKWKPEWLENEPKVPVSAYSYYQRNGFRLIRLFSGYRYFYLVFFVF